jgi:hypothetical protein
VEPPRIFYGIAPNFRSSTLRSRRGAQSRKSKRRNADLPQLRNGTAARRMQRSENLERGGNGAEHGADGGRAHHVPRTGLAFAEEKR